MYIHNYYDSYLLSQMMEFTSQIHEQRLRSSGQYSETEVKQAVTNVSIYQQLHQDRPGFFDTAVNTGLTTTAHIGQKNVNTATLLYDTLTLTIHTAALEDLNGKRP